MNIKRFTAATSREALAKARMTFGDATLILSNRPTANGVEVVATAEDALAHLNPGEAPVPQQLPQQQQAQRQALESLAEQRFAEEEAAAHPPLPRRPAANTSRTVEADTEQLAMSTLSFQDYVRERMLRRRHEALHGPSAGHPAPAPMPQRLVQPMQQAPERPLPILQPSMQPAMPSAQHSAPAFADRARDFAAAADRAADRDRPLPANTAVSTPVFPTVARHNPLRGVSLDLGAEPRRREPEAPALTQGLMNELQAMKDLIEDRFNTLTWLGQARQNPIQSNLMLKLIRAGYSPALARAVLERLPEEFGAAEAVRWLMEVLERNLKTDAHVRPLYETGGIFALVGATGVGKTTTTAKLAALCARLHGPGSVGLITLDTYRVGAHEQLRNFGRMLGVVAHLAHDRAALQDLLSLLGGKKMVLIDTTGVAPRDPRKREMMDDVIDLPGVQRLLAVNAGSHGDTLDDVLGAFKVDNGQPQQTILTKVDEAVKLAPAMDALIRHQAVLRGITNGQRVPEDWERADGHQLINQSMRSPAKSAFDPKAVELNFFFQSANGNGGLSHA
ncbi:MAG: flagellar biosynthesis protein FlhF [Acidovorax sp.]